MSTELDPSLDLCEQLLILLLEHPQGLSEYALIQQLKTRHCTHIPQLPLKDPLILFRTHFLIFNALYRLREQLSEQQSPHALIISPLCIELVPATQAQQQVAEQDPLRHYYLDMQHLKNTQAPDVELLLASFWTRMQGGDEKQAALELFELDPKQAVTQLQIKQRYRQLVSQHHPDRGGSNERLKSINLAMEILQRYY